MLDWPRMVPASPAQRPRERDWATATPFPPWRSTAVITTEQVRLADHTTLHLGGPAVRFVAAGSQDELVAVVRAADADAEPVLVLGGGSNLVVADEGFPGVVVHAAAAGLEFAVDGDAVEVTVQAGHD